MAGSIYVENFKDLFTLDEIADNTFRGHHLDFNSRFVYGGQIVSQAMIAAQNTTAPHQLQSLHGYFLRAGNKKQPIDYHVSILRDGSTFSTRQVTAMQGDTAIFEMLSLFQKEEEQPSLFYQTSMPNVAPPDDLRNESELFDGWLSSNEAQLLKLLGLPRMSESLRSRLLREKPVEVRPIDPERFLPNKGAPQPLSNSPLSALPSQYWFRFIDRSMDNSPILLKSALAYMSDYALLEAVIKPYGLSLMDRNVQGVSLDHSIWFHQEPNLDDWILYDINPSNMNDSRGLSSGKLFDSNGNLLATTSQEGLVRLRNTPC